MSQVQLPRARHSRHRPQNIHLLRTILINAGSVVVTALLFRTMVMIAVPNTTQRGLHLLARATGLVVWPLLRLPPLQTTVGGGLTLADVITLLVIVGAWLFALGIVAGWEQEGQRQSSGTSETGLRP